MRKIILLFLQSIFITYIFGQDMAKVNPYLMPPTPDAASFLRYGQYPVSNSTGIPQISIPIYTIETNCLKFPVNLSYYAGGIKVDDMASWVGLGWTLNAGGVINKTILDQPDEDEYQKFYIPSAADLRTNTYPVNRNVPSNNWECLWSAIYHHASSQGYIDQNYVDKMKDRYDYAFNGISGSFIVENGIAKQFSSSNNKITLLSSNGSIKDGFKIITPDGTSYYFSAKEETTISSQSATMSDDSNSPTISNSKVAAYTGVTAFYLTKITAFNNSDSINFLYENYASASPQDNSLSHSYTKTNSESSALGFQQITSLTSTTTSRQQRNTQILKEVSFRNGKIVFKHLKDRTDNRVHRLTNIEVYNINGELVKVVNFDNNSYFHRKRLKLNSVTFTGKDRSQICDSYVFDYYEEYEMPTFNAGLEGPETTYSSYYSQDLCGYFNGAFNERLNHFLPVEHKLISPANRSFSFEHARTYTLKKITYITGGETEFIYDSYPGNTSRTPALRIKEIISKKDKNQTQYDDHKLYKYKDAVYNYGKLFSEVEAYTDLTYNYSHIVTGLGPSPSECNILAKYSMSTSYCSSSGIENYFLTMQCKYDTVEEYTINSSANDTLKTVYVYENENPLYENTLQYSPRLSGLLGGSFYDTDWSGAPNYLPSGFFTMYTQENLTAGNAKGYLIDNGWKSSYLKEQISYKYENGKPVPIQKIINNYQYYKVNDKMRVGTYVKGLLAFSAVTVTTGSICAQPTPYPTTCLYRTTPTIDDYYFYDIYVSTGWKKLISTTQENYEKSGTISLQKTYKYADLGSSSDPYYNLVEYSVGGSNEKRKILKYSYPANDKSPACKKMVENYCINAVIREDQYSGPKQSNYYSDTIHLTRDEKKYSIFSINGKDMVLPESLTHKIYLGSNTEEINDKFISYDKASNLLEVTRSNGMSEAYYYGYSYFHYPVIKAENIDNSTLNAAYTSAIGAAGLSDISQIASSSLDEAQKYQLKQFNTSLRSNLLLKNALISTYTYSPLIGMTSQTDPNGKTTYYEYDSFGRLKCIKDNNGNILKTYDYHYKE